MALHAKITKKGKDDKNVSFAVGDRVRVSQTIKEADKKRKQVFEGMVISIRGKGETKTFTVRRIGAQNVGVERIFPLNAPYINSIEVVKRGGRGVKRAKLYYTRNKSKREIDKIYRRTAKREASKSEAKVGKQSQKRSKRTKGKTRSKSKKVRKSGKSRKSSKK